jgi:hypothetical protein
MAVQFVELAQGRMVAGILSEGVVRH